MGHFAGQERLQLTRGACGLSEKASCRVGRGGGAWDTVILADQAGSCPALDGKRCRTVPTPAHGRERRFLRFSAATVGVPASDRSNRRSSAFSRIYSPFQSRRDSTLEPPKMDGESLWLSAGRIPVVHLAGCLGTIDLITI